MLDAVKQEFCYGCSACATICPRHSIHMKPSKEGFKFPSIDKEKCIECGLCEKVCPVLQPKLNISSTVKKAYCAKPVSYTHLDVYKRQH